MFDEKNSQNVPWNNSLTPSSSKTMTTPPPDIKSMLLAAEITGHRQWAISVRITPELARVLLDNTKIKNRPKNKNRINRYGKSMKEGRFVLNGETVILTEDFQNLEGQHRLQTCVNTGVPFDTWVIVGVDPESRSTMGGGRPKTASDILTTKEHINTIALASASRWVNAIRKGFGSSSHAHLDNDEIADYVKANPGIPDSVHAVGGLGLLGPGIAGGLHYCFSEVNREVTNAFFNDLRHGANLGPEDPVLFLRKILTAEKTAKSRKHDEELCSIVIRAWDYRYNGKPCKTLRGTIKGEIARIPGFRYEK